MKTALIGYTGFVGGNIADKTKFDSLYNSKNIKEIEGQQFDLVVSAANKADMWRINQEADIDRAEIDKFISHLKKVKIKKLVLISSVGVYDKAVEVDEDTPIDERNLLPYGVNRLYLERYCADNFDTTIIRLPGLFGKGLKKNVIYDLLHDNMTDKIHWAGKYQYYNLENLWHDIQAALKHKLPLVNFATEPVQTKELAKVCFDIDNFANEPEGVSPANWDMRSKYAEHFGGHGHYLYSKKQELQDIKAFVNNQGRAS